MINYNFVMFSADGEGLPILYRLQDDGADITYCLKQAPIPEPERENKKILDIYNKGEAITYKDAYELEHHFEEIKCFIGASEAGNGLVKKRMDYDKMMAKLEKEKDTMTKTTIPIFDMNHNPKDADKLREWGYSVIGSGTFAEQMEHDRMYAIEAVKKYGIQIPSTYPMKSVDEAVKFLKSDEAKGKTYVFKPDNMEKSLTFVGETNDEMATFLESIKDKIKADFILQEKIKGLEASIEGWFNGTKFVLFDITLEDKHELAGHYGENCGAAGDVIFKVTTGKLIQEIKKVELLLKGSGIPQLFDLNFIINEQGAFFIEVTSRFGYSASLTLFNLFAELLKDVLIRLATGKLNWIKCSSDFGLSVRVYRNDINEGLPIIYPDKYKRNIWLWDAKKVNGKLQTSGRWTDLLTVTDTASTIQGASAKVYKILGKDLHIPNFGCHNGIGNDPKDIIKDYTDLKAQGWI
jgi:phosphoribosylamine-glycine ligase